MAPTSDQLEKIKRLESEIETRLKKYLSDGTDFLKDPPIIPEFTRLIDKVEEVGIPISRARPQDILPELMKKNNITKDEVTWEAKLHLNCYFAAVVHIFSNLRPEHHKLLNNVMKLDIDSIFPPSDDFFAGAEQSLQDDSDGTWEKIPKYGHSMLSESNRSEIAQVLDQTNLDLSNDIYNAFSLLRQRENQFTQEIRRFNYIQEQLRKFKEIQGQMEKYKNEIPGKIAQLQDTTKVYGFEKLQWENMPQDPQLCKISYCSREKEEKSEKGEKSTKSQLNHLRAKKVDSYFDSYIETRFFINKMARFLTTKEARKAYLELIQISTAFVGELGLCVYAGSKNWPLKIWTQNHEDDMTKPAQRQGKSVSKIHKIKVVYATLNSDDKECVNLLCETRNYSKTYTAIEKKARPKTETKSRSQASKPRVQKETNARKPQETINRNGKRTQPPREEGMDTKKKNKNN